jgi:hypothetical protein
MQWPPSAFWPKPWEARPSGAAGHQHRQGRRLPARLSVMLKPHFLERNVAYQKVWLEPHFDNHCASIAEDSIEVRTENAPPVYVGQIVTVYAVEPELPSF